MRNCSIESLSATVAELDIATDEEEGISLDDERTATDDKVTEEDEDGSCVEDDSSNDEEKFSDMMDEESRTEEDVNDPSELNTSVSLLSVIQDIKDPTHKAYMIATIYFFIILNPSMDNDLLQS